MRVRTPNLFEKILLVMGVLIILVGYALIYQVFKVETMISWPALQTLFLWLILICVIILVSVSENMKEEIRTVIENQTQEIRLLREDLRKK